MSVTAVKARKARPKLSDLSLSRDLYGEVVADLGFDPLPPHREIWDAEFIQLNWLALPSSPLQVESARAQTALPSLGGAA